MEALRTPNLPLLIPGPPSPLTGANPGYSLLEARKASTVLDCAGKAGSALPCSSASGNQKILQFGKEFLRIRLQAAMESRDNSFSKSG